MCIQDTGVCSYTLNNNSNPVHNTPLSYENLTAYIHNPSGKDKAGSMAIIMDQTLDSLVTSLPIIHPRIQSILLKLKHNITIHNTYHQRSNKLCLSQISAIPPTLHSIIAGDLNSLDNPSLDYCSSADIHAHNFQPIRTLLSGGFTDSFCLANPDDIKFTRWGKANHSGGTHVVATRIDHILVTPNLAKMISSSTILEDKEADSDHRVCITAFNLTSPSVIPLKPINVRKGLKDPDMWSFFTKSIPNVVCSGNIDDDAV